MLLELIFLLEPYSSSITQLNTLDHPADMTFNLTESPWIRAGRQYSVRVGCHLGSFNQTPCLSFSLRRIYGHTQTMAPLFEASQHATCLLMELWRFSWRMLATSLQGRNHLVREWIGVRQRMAHVLTENKRTFVVWPVSSFMSRVCFLWLECNLGIGHTL